MFGGTGMPEHFSFGGSGFGGVDGPQGLGGGQIPIGNTPKSGFGGAGNYIRTAFANRTGPMGGVAMGAAAIGVSAASGFNPYSTVPSPWQGALYGGFIFNPIKAAAVTGRGLWGVKEGVTPGKFGNMKYSGALGWKTALLGVSDNSSVWARMSVGNVGLSAVEMASKAFQGATGMDTPLMAKLTNARQLGLAGMANIGKDPKDALKHGWLYKVAGVDPDDLEFQNLRKLGIKGKGSAQFGARLTDDAISRGLQLTGRTAASRSFMVAGGMFSLYSWMSVFKDIAMFGATNLAEGVGEAARMLYQFTDELQKPEFGKGRLPMAMASGGAATERQRAIRASYGSKINPSGRMYGNEAMYHHSR